MTNGYDFVSKGNLFSAFFPLYFFLFLLILRLRSQLYFLKHPFALRNLRHCLQVRQCVKSSTTNLNSLPNVQALHKRRALPSLKLTSNEERKYQSRDHLQTLPLSNSNSNTSIPDIIGVELTDDHSLSSDDSEIIIDCGKFQRLPRVGSGVRGIVDSGCSVEESRHQQHHKKINLKNKIDRRLISTSRMSRRARTPSSRLPKL